MGSLSEAFKKAGKASPLGAFGLADSLGGIFKDKGEGNLQAKALAELQGVKQPTEDQLKLILPRLVEQGRITPEQAQTFLQGGTAFEDIGGDPTLRDAQVSALQQLQDISAGGGLTAMDKAKIAEIESRQGQQERGAREAIIQTAAERGRGGSGLELAAQLESQQGSATRAAQQGTDVAAMAQERALQAIMQGGELGGKIRTQDFGEASKVAEARDALQRFNLENMRSTEEANVGRRTAANEANLAAKTRTAELNAAAGADEARARAAAPQQVFENAQDRAKAIAGQYDEQAKTRRERANAKGQFIGSLIGAGGQIGAGAIAKSDERSKDISGEEPDLEAFLDELKPISFRYKDPKEPGAAEGNVVGVTAQDVERSRVGRTMVKDTGRGKVLDMRKGFEVTLAALAALNEKIDRIAAEAGG